MATVAVSPGCEAERRPDGRYNLHRKIRNYLPFFSQARFHASRARFKGLSGPVGTGKTKAVCYEAIQLAYANAGLLGLLSAPTFPMLRDITWRTMQGILEEEEIPFRFNRGEMRLYLRECGTTILFRSADDPDHLRGTNLAFFGVDELTYCSEEAWMRLEARLREPKAQVLCGFGGWTPKGFDWVYQRFISGTRLKGYEAIIAKPFENVAILTPVPDFYSRLKLSYDQKFYDQEVLGRYLSVFGGAVYYSFDRETNVKPVAYYPMWPVIWSLDFNVSPLSSIIGQLFPIDLHRSQYRLHVLDEISLPDANTPDAFDAFCRKLERFVKPDRRVFVEVYGDPAGNARHTAATKTDWQLIHEAFARHPEFKVSFHVASVAPPVKDRTTAVNSALRNAAGWARLYIHPRCKELIADLERNAWKQDSHGNVMTGQIDKTDPKRTHMADALGYLCHIHFGMNIQGGPQRGLLF